MSGALFLKCDECGAEIKLGSRAFSREALLAPAIKNGWTGPMRHESVLTEIKPGDELDRCPSCSERHCLISSVDGAAAF